MVLILGSMQEPRGRPTSGLLVEQKGKGLFHLSKLNPIDTTAIWDCQSLRNDQGWWHGMENHGVFWVCQDQLDPPQSDFGHKVKFVPTVSAYLGTVGRSEHRSCSEWRRRGPARTSLGRKERILCKIH